MAVVKWAAAPTNRGTVLTTQLNSLADDDITAAGAEIDNSINRDTHGVIELDVNFTSAPTDTLPLVNFYMIKAIDGTKYADGSASAAPGVETKVVDVTLRKVTGAQNKQSIIFELPPCKIKFIAEDKTGVSFPTTGSTATLYTMNLGSL